MKKKDIIKLVVICLTFLILFAIVMFIQLKDRVQTPFESNTLSKLKEIREFKQIITNDNITKIEVLSQITKNEFTNKDDIDKIVSFLETIEGYRISSSNVHLTSNAYEVFVYCGSDELIQISLTPTEFYIAKDQTYKIAFYKNSKNYYVQIRNLVEELSKD